MTDSNTVLYVAADEEAARSGAATLEAAARSLSAEPAVSVEAIRDRVDDADCAVFAETPTTAEGSHLLEILEVVGETPVVLFSTAEYGPTAARSTDGIRGYVRRDAPEAFAHLADEVAWVCHGRFDGSTEPTEGDRSASTDDTSPTAGSTDGDRSKIARLHEIATQIVACRDERRLFELVIETAERVLAFDASAILMYERRDDGEWLVPRALSENDLISGVEPARPTEGIAGKTFRTGETYRVDDVDADADAKPAHESFRSAISVPIGDQSVFQAISTERNGFDEADVELAEILCSHAGEALRRISAEERLRDRRETVTRLHEGAVRLVGATTESELYELTVEAAESILDFDVCYLGVVEDDHFVPRGRSSWPIRDDLEPLPLDYGLMGKTHESGESYLVRDAAEDDRTHSDRGEFRSCLSVPIEGVGVMQAISKAVDDFDETDLELAELLTAHVAEAVARLRAESELVSERDRLSALFDNVPDPAVRYEMVDGNAIVRDVNDAFESVFGYDRETIVGEDVDDYIVPPTLEDEANDLNECLLAGKTVRHVSKRRTANGDRDFLINVVPLEIGERSVEGFSIYTDITEQKRHERELAARNERLDEFASIVSHDLRNPLNVARGYLELASETGDEEHFAEIEAAHARMETLIEQLLTLARRGEVIDDAEPVALHDVARRAWSTVDTGDAELVLERDGIVEADKARLTELLENLLRNAVEHGAEDGDSPSEADALTIRIGTLAPEPTDDADRSAGDPPSGFFVADDGVGIPEDERTEVFDSGYTTADDGTGFGLSIVDRIADAHGWTAYVTESESGGARFVFHGVETEAVGGDRAAFGGGPDEGDDVESIDAGDSEEEEPGPTIDSRGG